MPAMISEIANRIATTTMVGPGQMMATMPSTMPTIEVMIRAVRTAPISSSGKCFVYAVAKVMVEGYRPEGRDTLSLRARGTN
ncbi:putative enoyl-CoA hydratase [Gordonia alkanivorans NBRC 16433]|uniref:Putative enoyl-CoA hydratase n=1 Tax=Gordonia alkanivorans NBRC 16433 TaxID=1027371 RepID=F9VQR4_9ACTN|nr:putative enoyl-CoA hydratase [Gordonia alkanivorans NBRC 16433]